MAMDTNASAFGISTTEIARSFLPAFICSGCCSFTVFVSFISWWPSSQFPNSVEFFLLKIICFVTANLLFSAHFSCSNAQHFAQSFFQWATFFFDNTVVAIHRIYDDRWENKFFDLFALFYCIFFFLFSFSSCVLFWDLVTSSQLNMCVKHQELAMIKWSGTKYEEKKTGNKMGR